MTVPMKLTIAQLNEEEASYRKHREEQVHNMYAKGFSFILCWNFHRDCTKAWEKAKAHKVTKITDVVRGLYIKEEFGKELILVALNQGQAGYMEGRLRPTYSAYEALKEIGVVPVKSTIKADLRNAKMESFRFAEAHEVVAFL